MQLSGFGEAKGELDHALSERNGILRSTHTPIHCGSSMGARRGVELRLQY